MQIIGYLDLPDVKGEADQADHTDQIEFFAIEWVELTQRATGNIGRGMTRGRVQTGPIRIKKWVDAATPYLMQAIFHANSFDDVIFSLVKRSGDETIDYMVITLKGAMLSRYDLATDEERDFSYEIVEFDFTEVTVDYTEQGTDHTAGAAHSVSHHFREA